MSYYPCRRPLVEYVIAEESCHKSVHQVYVRHTQADMLMACSTPESSHTLTETALKDITHQITPSRGNISTIWHAKPVDKYTKTEYGRLLAIVALGLTKLRPGIHLSVFLYPVS